MPTEVDFAYTGAAQTIAVPAGVESATLEVWGASGMDGAAAGGMGAHVVATISGLTPGEILYIYVGQAGQAAFVGGWNGGGNGMLGIANYNGNAGGGATDIRRFSNSVFDRILIGGGGGGAANRSEVAGGNGGYPTGGISGSAVAGGTQSGPGTNLSPIHGAQQVSGSLAQGANTPGSSGSGRKIGGGGGGLWGGNSGNGGSSFNIGGGGGSSYYDPSLTDVTAEASGTWDGNGKAKITWPDPQVLSFIDLGGMEVSGVGGITRTKPWDRPVRHSVWVHGLNGVRRVVLD